MNAEWIEGKWVEALVGKLAFLVAENLYDAYDRAALVRLAENAHSDALLDMLGLVGLGYRTS